MKIITIYLPDLTAEYVLRYLTDKLRQALDYSYVYVGYCSYELLRLLSERYEVVEKDGDRVALMRIDYPTMLAAIIEEDMCYGIEARYDIGPQYIDSEWGIEDE